MKRYPIKVSVEVYITDGNGTSGTATYGMGFSQFPTEEKIAEIVAEVSSNLPPDFRIANRFEATSAFMQERTGRSLRGMALPPLDEGDEWHDPDAAQSYDTQHGYDDDEDEE